MSVVRNDAEAAEYNEAAFRDLTWNRGIVFNTTKRSMDLVASLIGLILLSPVFLVLAILIKIEDPKGPVFFKQKRFGKNSNMFSIYKFRSMATNAEQRLKEDPALYEKYVANNYKLEQDEDPRITSIGRFLRKTSLDELPQLLNVLKGEMSLVGPRPIVAQELKEYKDRKDDLLSVKPGVTGYWQVSGRSDVGYPERVDLELHYVYHRTIWLDIRILFATVVSVLLKRGAY
ncbi:sugar transferase [Saccharibacillus endophyticus]|uniref:Exopolysaccharide biosynthesis protein n=1 Tax=Saccharibacillus endophyticus TaxID=2060666 RepID=A0ABQ1ZKG3_9BACL|nr:sugar transferase [Saccharibacillus endophyticus]GGH67250.1 exopolysaccharide biosynthesis protein [Saccharibacillus endophyticus]